MPGLFLLPLTLVLGPQGPGPTPAADAPVRVTVRIEELAERFGYDIANPSTFEPGPLVPHRIEQRYRVEGPEVGVRADYRMRGMAMTSLVGLLAPITSPGSDVDTFFQPSGDVVTSGTRGRVRLWTLRLDHRIDMIRWRDWRVGVRIGYRRSTMDFLPSDRIVTHTKPPSEVREPVGGDETTWSHVIASGLTATLPPVAASRWQLRAGIEVTPITRARLVIALPLKFPGQRIRQDTFGGGLGGWLDIERPVGPVTVGAGLRVGRVWSYGRSARYFERQLAGGVFLGLEP